MAKVMRVLKRGDTQSKWVPVTVRNRRALSTPPNPTVPAASPPAEPAAATAAAAAARDKPVMLRALTSTLPEKKANGRALRSAKNKSNIGNKKTSENDGGTEVVNEPSSKAPRSENSGKKDTKRKASAIDEDDANSKDGDYDKPQYKRNRVVLPDDAYDLDITDDEDQHKDGKQGDVLTKEPKKPSKGQKAAANTKVGAKKGRSAANASATKKAAPAKGKEKSNANDEPQVEREDKIKAKSNFKTALKKEAEALDPAPLKIRVGVFSLDVAAQGFRDLGWSNMSEQDIAASKLQTHDHLPVSR